MQLNPLSSYFSGREYSSTLALKQDLREMIQKISLLGLWRSTFFEYAAFYGGTTLRLLHGMERFSEDLDFSLLKQDPDFRFDAYFPAVVKELEAWGIQASILGVQKQNSKIESAFVKANTLQNMMNLELPEQFIKSLHRDEISTIKLEIDPDPPSGFATEIRYVLEPIPFGIKIMSLPDLFAGKMHAVLARAWQNRVKGRDWYDLIWYIKKGSKLNLKHLEARLKQRGHLDASAKLSPELLQKLLAEKIETVDFKQAAEDVRPFIADPREVENWSKELFEALLGILFHADFRRL